MIRATQSVTTCGNAVVDEAVHSENNAEKPKKSKGKKEHVRKKVWRPKTKTGCITCR